MQIIESSYFYYKNNEFYCGDVPVKKLIEKYGTPLYVYNKQYFIDQYNKFDKAFSEVNHKIFYAAKSNFNLSVIKTFVDLGAGVDVNSGGELFRALKTGVNPHDLILTGVGKNADEIKAGLENGVLMIKAESEEEITLINEIAKQMNKTANVAIRVNPDVDAQTHPYISTGLAENKFGIDKEKALEIYGDFKLLSNIKFTGIDMHIGSQITTTQPFVDAAEKLSEIYFTLKGFGLELKHFDMGGGIGVPYKNEKVFEVSDLANKLLPIFKKLNCQILFEPGRFLTANGGVLLSKILYVKNNGLKNFYVIDSALNDLLRPSFYGAYHHIQPVVIDQKENENITADIVGPICESGDFLAKDRTITTLKHNEYLAVLSSGAYGMVMSSNYNARRRAAEILVDKNHSKVIRSRETFDHLIYDELKAL